MCRPAVNPRVSPAERAGARLHFRDQGECQASLGLPGAAADRAVDANAGQEPVKWRGRRGWLHAASFTDRKQAGKARVDLAIKPGASPSCRCVVRASWLRGPRGPLGLRRQSGATTALLPAQEGDG